MILHGYALPLLLPLALEAALMPIVLAWLGWGVAVEVFEDVRWWWGKR